MRVRQSGNKLWIPRPNIQIENELDRKYKRTGKLSWEVPTETPVQDKPVNVKPVNVKPAEPKKTVDVKSTVTKSN